MPVRRAVSAGRGLQKVESSWLYGFSAVNMSDHVNAKPQAYLRLPCGGACVSSSYGEIIMSKSLHHRHSCQIDCSVGWFHSAGFATRQPPDARRRVTRASQTRRVRASEVGAVVSQIKRTERRTIAKATIGLFSKSSRQCDLFSPPASQGESVGLAGGAVLPEERPRVTPLL